MGLVLGYIGTGFSSTLRYGASVYSLVQVFHLLYDMGLVYIGTGSSPTL